MKDANRAPFYVCMYEGLADIARRHGYALAIHGSVITDMDLVAIPWTEEAVEAETVVAAITEHIQALDYPSRVRADLPSISDENLRKLVESVGYKEVARKPHGRRAWNLYLGHGARVDLSVMPLTKAAEIAG